MDKIYYESADNKLCGILTESLNKEQIVIMCHGIRGNKDECNSFVYLAEELKKCGYSSFRFDFNGHGESSGNDYDMTITKEIKDIQNTIIMLKSKGYKEFILLGGSFGASIVSLLPYQNYNCIKGLVFWYGAINYDYIKYGNLFTKENKQIAEKNKFYISKSINTGENFKFGMDLFNEVNKFKPYEELKKCNLPKLFVHGDIDSAIPYKVSKEVSELCNNSEFKLIKNGEHTFANSKEALNNAIDVTIAFIRQYL